VSGRTVRPSSSPVNCIMGSVRKRQPNPSGASFRCRAVLTGYGRPNLADETAVSSGVEPSNERFGRRTVVLSMGPWLRRQNRLGSK
jgi:hypothetical protein